MALLIGVVTVVRSQPDVPEPGAEPLGPSWTRPLPDVVALAVSPDGDRTLAVDLDNHLHCYNNHGERLWEQHLATIDAAAVSRKGALTLAYAVNQPLSRRVWFLDEKGETLHIQTAPEPVQTAIVSPDGKFVVIAAGRKLVFCSRKDRAFRSRVISLPSVPGQIQFGPADSLYVVLRNPDRVQLLKSSGKVLWERSAPGATDFSIAASETGRYVAVGSQRPNDQVHVALVDSRNTTAWTNSFPGRQPRVRLNAAGDAVILSYERKVEHNADRRYERRLTYLGRDAGDIWTKGGPFTAPYYVSVDRNGGWVVVLDTQQQRPGGDQLPRFRLYGRSGERRWVYTCPSNILIATASFEGRHIATYRADGILECMRVVPR